MLPSPETRVKLSPLLVDDDPAMIEALTPVAADESPANMLNAPPLPSPASTEIEMLPPESGADDPLPMSTTPLSPTLALPVFHDKAPDTLDTPALLVDIAALSELVAVPTPDEIVMEPPKAVAPSPDIH